MEQIQKDSKIGTAYERYDIQHLWDLGEQIRQYGSIAADNKDVVAEVIDLLARRSIKCLPLLLKNAETTRTAWSTKEEFLKVAVGTSYGKLREALPIFDPEFVSQNKVSKEDLETLGRSLADSTYEKVLELARRLREKYDPNRMSVDYDAFYQELYSATEKLRSAMARRDAEDLREFRQKFSPELIDYSRRLLAAMKNEERFKKLAAGFPSDFTRTSSGAGEDLESNLSEVIQTLSQIRKAPASARESLRQRIGIARLGELSTLMKAASSDEEMERYLRGQRLLERIRLPEVNG